ncbi:MAG: hypothetical protein RLZZ127_255 [Planctomycetota bacterium]
MPHGRASAAARPIAAFTAIEMIVVLGVISIILGLTIPSVLSATKRAAVQDGVRIINEAWLIARNQAMATAPPSGLVPKHFGVAVRTSGGRITASVVYSSLETMSGSDIDAALLRSAVIQPDGSVSRSDAAGTATYQRTATSTAVLAVDTGNGVLNADDRIMLWYAQYRTGFPVSSATVAAGTALTATPIGIGIAGSPVAARLLSATPDYDRAAGTGFASALRIFHVGVSSVDAP